MNWKKFFEAKLWQIGILVGVLFSGLIGIFYFKDIPTLGVCEGFAAGFWLSCLLLALGLFFGPSIIGGIICAYIIKGIVEVIRGKKKKNMTILLIAIIAVLAIAGICYFYKIPQRIFTPQPSEPETISSETIPPGYEIYKHKIYGYDMISSEVTPILKSLFLMTKMKMG